MRGTFDNPKSQRKVFRTTDGGVSWSNITSNLPDVPAHVLRIGAGNVLYLGTDTGVYTSNNLGISWVRCGRGLPNVQVLDMDLNRKLGVLAVGTHGRGMWEIALMPAKHTRRDK